MHVVSENNKSIGQVAADLKNDARDFVSTRLQMLSQEVAVPLLAIALLLGGLAFLVFTFALVSFLAAVFAPSTYAWCYGALIVVAIYFVAAFGAYYFGKRELTQAGLAPTRTLSVLKQDQIWIQNEARSQV
jgi:uncharacterized membrane protein YqjE